MPKSKSKKRLPSQQKYDQTHPTVSFRLPLPLYIRLKQHVGEHSFSSFVRSHLENEEAQIKARVEELVRQRSNLWADTQSYQRQLRELEEQVRKRKQEIMKPLEEEKAQLKAQIDGWYRLEKQRFEFTRVENGRNLTMVRSQVTQELEQLRKARMDLIFVETRCKTLEQQSKKWLEEKETWEKKMQKATEVINRCPWFFCYQCPGAAFNQILLTMMNTVTSLQASQASGKEPKDDSAPAKAQESSQRPEVITFSSKPAGGR